MVINPYTGKINLYEAGRTARIDGVKIADCLYHPNTRHHQEWCIGWLDEDWVIIGAIPIDEKDFVQM